MVQPPRRKLPRVRGNRIQFAVVREDADVEAAVVARRPAGRALLIASGGCTALTLAGRFEDLDLVLLDPNEAQLAHVEAKIAALGDDVRRFNVGDDDPAGLSECGNFESLFRGLRGFLHDLVLPRDGWVRFFDEGGEPTFLENPYWPVAFELFFADPLLNTMFGPDATQHAPPGSYPGYFRELFERGLRRPDVRDNRFLHHVLLGCYLPRAMPEFLVRPPRRPRFDLRQGFLPDVEDLDTFDVVGLSNILDWMAPAKVSELVELLCDRLRPGATVVWRQLNNDRDVEALFGDRVTFDRPLADRLHAADRSLFYSSLHIGVRA